MTPTFKIFVVALSLALDVFAVSVGVGVRGVPGRVKLRIGISFACAEIVMNLVGAGLGAVAGRLLGDVAGYIGFTALLGLGLYMVYESRRDNEDRLPLDMSSGWGLLLASLSISLDSLGIGFSILYIGVPLAVSLVTIGAVSILATAAGLTLGKRLGVRIEDNAEVIGGVLLALTGAAFIVLKAMHVG
ncbi:MAG: manganese efflux pump MntP family protein [Candidatus Eremiobacteraeota bacterium]|nr:manganese efflux pump MntP family protein [Candidatus Eremiobacteraeota bacterium]